MTCGWLTLLVPRYTQPPCRALEGGCCFFRLPPHTWPAINGQAHSVELVDAIHCWHIAGGVATITRRLDANMVIIRHGIDSTALPQPQLPGRIGIPNALLCSAPPFDKPATSAGVPHAARQGEVAGSQGAGLPSADGDPPPVFVDAPLVGRAYCWALRSAIQDDTWS